MLSWVEMVWLLLWLEFMLLIFSSEVCRSWPLHLLLFVFLLWLFSLQARLSFLCLNSWLHLNWRKNHLFWATILRHLTSIDLWQLFRHINSYQRQTFKTKSHLFSSSFLIRTDLGTPIWLIHASMYWKQCNLIELFLALQ